jgi:hypothetical protein
MQSGRKDDFEDWNRCRWLHKAAHYRPKILNRPSLAELQMGIEDPYLKYLKGIGELNVSSEGFEEKLRSEINIAKQYWPDNWINILKTCFNPMGVISTAEGGRICDRRERVQWLRHFISSLRFEALRMSLAFVGVAAAIIPPVINQTVAVDHYGVVMK